MSNVVQDLKYSVTFCCFQHFNNQIDSQFMLSKNQVGPLQETLRLFLHPLFLHGEIVRSFPVLPWLIWARLYWNSKNWLTNANKAIGRLTIKIKEINTIDSWKNMLLPDCIKSFEYKNMFYKSKLHAFFLKGVLQQLINFKLSFKYEILR